MTDRERAALLWATTADTNAPPEYPRLKLPRGLLGWLLLFVLVPIAVPLLVITRVTYRALTGKRVAVR